MELATTSRWGLQSQYLALAVDLLSTTKVNLSMCFKPSALDFTSFSSRRRTRTADSVRHLVTFSLEAVKWVVFFFVMWGLIILLVPTRGLRLAYAVTVGAYAGRSWRKFAYAAYARVVLFRKCLRGYSPGGFLDLSHSSNVRKTKRHETFGSTMSLLAV